MNSDSGFFSADVLLISENWHELFYFLATCFFYKKGRKQTGRARSNHAGPYMAGRAANRDSQPSRSVTKSQTPTLCKTFHKNHLARFWILEVLRGKNGLSNEFIIVYRH